MVDDIPQYAWGRGRMVNDDDRAGQQLPEKSLAQANKQIFNIGKGIIENPVDHLLIYCFEEELT